MKTKNSGPSPRARKLHNLGRLLAIKHLSLKVKGLDFNLSDAAGKSVKVMVQNRMPDASLGDCFTIDVDTENSAIMALKTDRLIFVDYDDEKLIRIYECPDHECYTTKYVGGGQEWRRIAMCFPISKMNLVLEVNDPEVLSDMKKNSSAKKFRRLPAETIQENFRPSTPAATKPTWMSY